jgi:hypothetical protein
VPLPLPPVAETVSASIAAEAIDVKAVPAAIQLKVAHALKVNTLGLSIVAAQLS